MHEVKDKEFVLAGDGRCDSPGKCAKYCTFSLIEQDNNLIVHMETLDKRGSFTVSEYGKRGTTSITLIFK